MKESCIHPLKQLLKDTSFSSLFSVANHTDLSDIWPVQQKHKFHQGHDLVYEFLGRCSHKLVKFHGR